MKKVVKIVLLLILLLLILHILTNCQFMYGNHDFSVQNLHYVAHDLFPFCYVADYSWPAGQTGAVIDILDVCEGRYVTMLGGHPVEPFLVNLQNAQYICSESVLPSDAAVEQYHLVLNLSENIVKAEYIEMDLYHCIRRNQFVQILVTIHCSDENPVFYSDNGKLYRRSDNSLVDGFFYYSDYSA